jgi:hypothetical protein
MSTAETACACGGCSSCGGSATRPTVADPLVFRHGAIKARLLARIGSTEIEGARPLEALGTRDDDDPTIALIDAFSGALHILAWNASRLSDDGSIQRTEDRDALVDLTRLLGYEPRPAISATTTLAFMVDAFPGSPATATVPKGTKVASVPGQDEKPQIFETDEALDARVEWNALLPVQRKTVPKVSVATSSITIEGTSTVAKPGDLVLAYMEPQASSSSWLLARIATVERSAPPPPAPPRTIIGLSSPRALSSPASLQGNAFKNSVVVLGQKAAAFGATAPDLSLMSKEIRRSQLPPSNPLPGRRTGDAAEVGSRKLVVGDGLPTEWLNLMMKPAGTTGLVDLDAVCADAVADRVVVFNLTNNGTRLKHGTRLTQVGRITSATELGRKDYGLSAKVTRIGVEGIDRGLNGYRDKVRETTIYIETAREKLLVIDADVAMPETPTDRLTVQGAMELPVGRRIALSGEQWTSSPGTGARVGEVATLKSCTVVQGVGTELVFDRAVATSFRSTTLVLMANCVRASHGDTPATGAEVIGSSSTATLSPRFPLKRSPLTYLPSPDPRGYAPAIEVRVGDREYGERPTLFGLTRGDRAFTVRSGRNDAPDVQFAGRLATGSYNVTALYRSGAGKDGNLAAGRLTTVMTPILGVGAAGNPVPTAGGSDAETIDEMRTAGPRSIRTLDRVVSLADFEAFARTRPGIGKALATELHVGMRSVVCLTIATTELKRAAAGSDVVEGLRTALASVSAPGRSVRIEGFAELAAKVTAALAIDPALRRADIEAAARQKLVETFGRPVRAFGAALHRSEVLAALHEVEGVVAANLTQFVLSDGTAEEEGRLLCSAPAMVNRSFVEAGLLSIAAPDVQFVEMQP